jgi:hypothetical protein
LRRSIIGAKLDDAADVVKHWNTEEPAQCFWVDDAFGVMQYESYLAHRWNHALPEVKPCCARM